MAANAWGEKRSKPMNTLNWEKLPTFKAGRTLWAAGGAATASLEQLLGGEGKSLQLDLGELEGMFAKPEVKPRFSTSVADERSKVSKVTLLDAKRSTSVGIVMKRITDALQGKELRDALMDVDENVRATASPSTCHDPSEPRTHAFPARPSVHSCCHSRSSQWCSRWLRQRRSARCSPIFRVMWALSTSRSR